MVVMAVAMLNLDGVAQVEPAHQLILALEFVEMVLISQERHVRMVIQTMMMDALLLVL